MRQAKRTCARCGDIFNGTGLENCCSECKKPRTEFIVGPLTLRELQVVRLVHDAKENKEIADELHLGVGTIKEYLVIIFRKLDVKNRVALALWAERHWYMIQPRKRVA